MENLYSVEEPWVSDTSFKSASHAVGEAETYYMLAIKKGLSGKELTIGMEEYAAGKELTESMDATFPHIMYSADGKKQKEVYTPQEHEALVKLGWLHVHPDKAPI